VANPGQTAGNNGAKSGQVQWFTKGLLPVDLYGCEAWTGGGGPSYEDVPGEHQLQVIAWTFMTPRTTNGKGQKMVAIKHKFVGGANDGKDFIRRFTIEGLEPDKLKSALNYMFGYLDAIGCEYVSNPKKPGSKQVPKFDSIVGRLFMAQITTGTFTNKQGQERTSYDIATETIQLVGQDGAAESPADDMDEPSI